MSNIMVEYARPADGEQDLSDIGWRFHGDEWTYSFDTTPPVVPPNHYNKICILRRDGRFDTGTRMEFVWGPCERREAEIIGWRNSK